MRTDSTASSVSVDFEHERVELRAPIEVVFCYDATIERGRENGGEACYLCDWCNPAVVRKRGN